MNSLVLERSIEVIESLRPIVPLIQRLDPRLAEQLRSAASSVPLNIAEAYGRQGKDRRNRFRIALGSCREVAAAIRVAIAWGHIEPAITGTALSTNDEVARMLWCMTR